MAGEDETIYQCNECGEKFRAKASPICSTGMAEHGCFNKKNYDIGLVVCPNPKCQKLLSVIIPKKTSTKPD